MVLKRPTNIFFSGSFCHLRIQDKLAVHDPVNRGSTVILNVGCSSIQASPLCSYVTGSSTTGMLLFWQRNKCVQGLADLQWRSSVPICLQFELQLLWAGSRLKKLSPYIPNFWSLHFCFPWSILCLLYCAISIVSSLFTDTMQDLPTESHVQTTEFPQLLCKWLAFGNPNSTILVSTINLRLKNKNMSINVGVDKFVEFLLLKISIR